MAACFAAPAAAAAPAPDATEAEYRFAVHVSEQEGVFRDAARLELEAYLRRHPEGAHVDDVHHRLARLAEEREALHLAAARYLQVLVVDAGSPLQTPAHEALEQLLGRRPLRSLQQRYRAALTEFAGPVEDVTARRARYIRALLLIADAETADLLGEELASLLEARPPAPGLDRLVFEVAGFDRRCSRPRRALAGYERIGFLWPESTLAAASLLAAGELLSEDMGEPVAALSRYRRIAREHASSSEAPTAWLRMGLLERDQLARPDVAMRDFDEVLNRYPDHPDAFEAMLSKAETLADSQRDYAGAVATLTAGAARYPEHSRAPVALDRAGRLLERKLDDPVRAAQQKTALAARYPGYARAPEAIYEAAELMERAGQVERALELYNELGRRYPGSRFAEKASKRSEKLSRAR